MQTLQACEIAVRLPILTARGVSHMNVANNELRVRARLKSLAVAVGIFAALASAAALAQRNVDTVITHGKILTVDADFRVVEALAVDDGRIVARGTSAEVMRYAGADTKTIDVAGATVVPGLIDNHFHFTRGVDTWHEALGVHGAAMQAGAHMPLRKIADSGIVFGLGTDATIVSHYSPFVTLGWVVSGLDVGGNRVLDETLTREEALIAHTRSNAYLFFQESALGSLEVGKQADLVVLDRDYMTVPAADIKHIRPTLTMVGGRVVFSMRPP